MLSKFKKLRVKKKKKKVPMSHGMTLNCELSGLRFYRFIITTINSKAIVKIINSFDK